MDKLSLEKELDLFLKNNTIIQLVKALHIPDDSDTLTKDRPSIVFGHSLSSMEIFELEKRVKKAENAETLEEFVQSMFEKKQASHKDLQDAGISKEYWHKLVRGKIKQPSKAKLLCIAIALKLNLEETEKLLRKAGYSLARDVSVFESIIGFFIEKGIYCITTIDEYLVNYNQPTLFSIE
ncbi:hypothetical protein [Parageobacillus thermoglucosidasius]|uniref:hypothetical protein n=2 Tax=Parageobacillus thermoglucosidasius TaxID=1426 RepID=UPI000B552ABC|nr:hypothetical protein [Parageobacillus thermoglucosidasius]OUM88669.1 MAG: hypothetical protein BAA00_00015 [Parageobacillus thermoglucosidasius]